MRWQKTCCPFKYVGGDPAVDLVNTVDWTRDGLKDERLGDYQRLTRWAEGSGVVSPDLAAKLRRRSSEAAGAREHRLPGRPSSPRNHPAIVSRARREGRRPPGRSRTSTGSWRLRFRHLRVTPLGTAPRLQLGWEDEENRLDSVLWPVLWSAASLITSEEASRIRVCGGEDCGWMYVDRSRNGLRRWCQMESCGTREKTRRRRQGAAAAPRS